MNYSASTPRTLFGGIKRPNVLESSSQDRCSVIEETEDHFFLLIIAPAALLILLLSFLKTRKQLGTGCCWSRPALIYPVNFIDETSRRWSHAAVFAVLAYRVYNLTEGKYVWMPEAFDDPDWVAKYGFLKGLVGMLNAVIVAILYYPLLAAISLRRYLVSNFIGLMYLGAWFYNHINIWVTCYGSGNKTMHYTEALFEAPMLLCLAVLLVTFILDLVINIRAVMRHKKSLKCALRDKIKFYLPGGAERDSLSVTYVKALFKRQPKTKPETTKEKIKKMFTYTATKGFKYSPRVLCTLIVAAFGLYKAAIVVTVQVCEIYEAVDRLLDQNRGLFVALNHSELYYHLKGVNDVFKGSSLVSNYTAAGLHLVFIIHIFICYRRNLRRLYRGKTDWIPDKEKNPINVTVASMRYPGYQIAYIIYGYFVMWLLLVVICFLIAYMLVKPLLAGRKGFLIEELIKSWPTILISLVTYFSQYFAAKLLFLQDKGKFLALNNRRLFHIVNFFLLFFNVLLGLFSCLKRVLLSLVFGLLLISRLDKCLLMPGFEKLDSGYKSYLGMLYMDLYHNHPILKAFVEILNKSVSKRHAESNSPRHQKKDDAEKGESVQLVNGKDKDEDGARAKRKRICNKWWKCYILLKNPTVVLDQLYTSAKKKKKLESSAAMAFLDQAATVGAIVTGSVVATEIGETSA